jgi:hypothetical protein
MLPCFTLEVEGANNMCHWGRQHPLVDSLISTSNVRASLQNQRELHCQASNTGVQFEARGASPLQTRPNSGVNCPFQSTTVALGFGLRL